jgi:hypothetical protein
MTRFHPFAALRRMSASPSARETLPAGPGPTIDFRAFTPTAVVQGQLVLTADRLTDALNTGDGPLVLTEATLTDLGSLEETPVGTILVPREQLLVVAASGPSGSPSRRYRTKRVGADLTIGRYRVHGVLHGPPGSQPDAALYRRRPMVPVSEAVVSYSAAGQVVVESFDAVIIARDEVTEMALLESRRLVPEPVSLPPDANDGGTTPLLEPSTRAIHTLGGSTLRTTSSPSQ